MQSSSSIWNVSTRTKVSPSEPISIFSRFSSTNMTTVENIIEELNNECDTFAEEITLLHAIVNFLAATDPNCTAFREKFSAHQEKAETLSLMASAIRKFKTKSDPNNIRSSNDALVYCAKCINGRFQELKNINDSYYEIYINEKSDSSLVYEINLIKQLIEPNNKPAFQPTK